MKDKSKILNFMFIMQKIDCFDRLLWEVDQEKGNIEFSLICSDLFNWGTADCEKIDESSISLLEKAISDLEPFGFENVSIYAIALYCCRKRECRPQGASYPEEKEMWHLFNECGPERESGIGNPFPIGHSLKKS